MYDMRKTQKQIDDQVRLINASYELMTAIDQLEQRFSLTIHEMVNLLLDAAVGFTKSGIALEHETTLEQKEWPLIPY